MVHYNVASNILKSSRDRLVSSEKVVLTRFKIQDSKVSFVTFIRSQLFERFIQAWLISFAEMFLFPSSIWSDVNVFFPTVGSVLKVSSNDIHYQSYVYGRG